MKLKSLFLTLTTGMLVSCSSIGYVAYDRLQPAQINFPAEVHRVGVLNAVPTGNEDLDDDGKMSGNGAIAVESLAREIANTNYFDQVVVSDSVLRKESTFSAGLSPHEQDYFLKSLGVDMLFVMNKVNVQLKKGELFLPEMPYPLPVIDGYVTPEVLVYVPERTQPLYTIQKTDTLFWESTHSLEADSVVKDVSEFAGVIPVRLLIPYWQETIRPIFSDGNVTLRDAAFLVRENEWKEAADLWTQVYEKAKGKLKYKAAYNLAVYTEYMGGDLNQVNAYLDVALGMVKKGSEDEAMMRTFKAEFERDFANQQRLHVQMQRFENKKE